MSLAPANMPIVHLAFPAAWTARVLAAPPMIAPARSFTWPERVPGEDDAMARGALLLDVATESHGRFFVTCARGFRDPAAVTGVWSMPAPHTMLAVAGGYAYLVDTRTPERCNFLPVRPVLSLLPAIDDALLLVADSYTVAAIDSHGVRWQSARASDEGITLTHAVDGIAEATGWSLRTGRDTTLRLRMSDGALLA